MAGDEVGGASRFQDNFRALASSFCAGEAATIFPNVVLSYANTLPERRQVSLQQSGRTSGGVSLAGCVWRPVKWRQAFCPERGPWSACGWLQHLRERSGDREGQEPHRAPRTADQPGPGHRPSKPHGSLTAPDPGTTPGEPCRPLTTPDLGIAQGEPHGPLTTTDPGTAPGEPCRPLTTPDLGIAQGEPHGSLTAPDPGTAPGEPCRPLTTLDLGIAPGEPHGPLTTVDPGTTPGKPCRPLTTLDPGTASGKPCRPLTTPDLGITQGEPHGPLTTADLGTASGKPRRPLTTLDPGTASDTCPEVCLYTQEGQGNHMVFKQNASLTEQTTGHISSACNLLPLKDQNPYPRRLRGTSPCKQSNGLEEETSLGLRLRNACQWLAIVLESDPHAPRWPLESRRSGRALSTSGRAPPNAPGTLAPAFSRQDPSTCCPLGPGVWGLKS
ncbi:unnamed protein product [Rangifer tarandus platyrhynchus]